MITLYNEQGIKLRDIYRFELVDADMGEKTISADISFSEKPNFHPMWYVEMDGEKFYLGKRKPQGRKDTNSINVIYPLVFKSHRELLKDFPFMDFVELGSNNPQPSDYIKSLYCTITEFVDRFNLNLQYWIPGWKMSLSPDFVDDGTYYSLSFDNASLWDVLLHTYENTQYRWIIRGSNILLGYGTEEIEHIFEYGKGNGLVSIERVSSDERIITRLRGKGGDRNLPDDYFHDGDPDTNSILQTIYYNKLLPFTYREYVRGYNSGVGKGTYAYNQGVSDKINNKPMAPIDYVVSDKESEWGVKYGTISDIDNIYPTIQGIERSPIGRVDEIVDIEQVLTDSDADIQEADTKQVMFSVTEFLGKVGERLPGETAVSILEEHTETRESNIFDVTSEYNSLHIQNYIHPYIYKDGTSEPIKLFPDSSITVQSRVSVIDYDTKDDIYDEWDTEDMTLKNIPIGRYIIKVDYHIKGEVSDVIPLNTLVNLRFEALSLLAEYVDERSSLGFKNTFDIWIKDVWNIPRNVNEPDEKYIARVWNPLLTTNDMTVMFSSGMLAGEDYEFRVVGVNGEEGSVLQAISFDESKELNGVKSFWRLRLEKSTAEYDASGKYLPNTMIQGKPGDFFFFTNIKMPYDPYVFNAEQRLQSYLEEELALKDAEFPTFSISPSRIFCGNFPEHNKIIAGNKIRLRHSELVGDSYIVLTIQSVTKTYSDNINPNWQITVTDKVVATGNPISLLEGQVNVINAQVYSNKQAVKDAINSLSSTFLRKDGISDTSFSPTHFEKGVTISSEGIKDEKFREGDISGQGFGVYTDSNGNRVIESDIVVARLGTRFNEVKINQATYIGGKQIFSAAAINVSKVEEYEEYWRCYFDTKSGSILNLFKVGDGAYSQRFGSDNNSITYWNRVINIGPDFIDLSKSDCLNNSVQPSENDTVIQLGNNVDAYRQSAIMIDVVRSDGGLMTWYDNITGFTLSDTTSINIGRLDNKTWLQVYGNAFIGTPTNSQYIWLEDGQLKIKANLEIESSIGDVELGDIANLSYLGKALKENTSVMGGLIQTSLLSLGYTKDDIFRIMSGTNGIFDAEKNGGGIASWWGGDMLDKMDYYQWTPAGWAIKEGALIPKNIAKGLIRFDGTGYLADGAIWWDKNGEIHADPTALLLSFDPVVGDETIAATIVNLRKDVLELQDHFTKKNVGTIENPEYILETEYSLSSKKEVISYSSSSKMLKNIQPKNESYSQKLLSIGDVVDYQYNDILPRDKEIHTGLIYENVKDIIPLMCGEKDGYGALNYISPEYINLIAGATQENTKAILSLIKKLTYLCDKLGLENEIRT